MDATILQSWLDDDLAASYQENAEFEQALAYYSANQLPRSVGAAIKERGNLRFIENVYQAIINVFLGRKQQSLTTIKVIGTQEQDAPLANILNQILNSYWSRREFLGALLERDKFLISGCGVFELLLTPLCAGGYDIALNALRADHIVIDRYSTRADASDARRFTRKFNVPAAHARALFGSGVIADADGGVYDERAIIYETWAKDERGLWHRYFWQNSNLLKFEFAPLCGGRLHPFVIRKFKLDENGNYFGLFRDLKALQDNINFNENKQTDMLAKVQVLYEGDAINDENEFLNAINRNDVAIRLRSGALNSGKIQINQNLQKLQVLNEKTNQKRELMRMISGISEDIFGATNTTRQTENFKREFSEISLKVFLGASELMDMELCRKMIDLIQFYFNGSQIYKMVDERQIARYIQVSGEDFNAIRASRFDCDLVVTPQNSSENNNFAYWSEIFKSCVNVAPELALELLVPMFKSLKNPFALDIEEAKTRLQEAQAQNAQGSFAAQVEQAQLAELLAKIENIQADTAKKQGQGDAALAVAMGKIQENEALTAPNSNLAASGASGDENGATTRANGSNPARVQIRGGAGLTNLDLK